MNNGASGVPSLLPEPGYPNPFNRDVDGADAIDDLITVAGAEIFDTELYDGIATLTVGRTVVNDRL